MLEMYDGLPNTNTLQDDKAITSGWQAYKEVNRAFRDKVRHESDSVRPSCRRSTRYVE